MARQVVIGVMGSGTDELPDLAEPLGRWIAQEGWSLLTGAGRGVMTSVTRAFCAVPDRAGRALGVVPGWIDQDGSHGTKDGYPNEHVELAIVTHLPLSGEWGTHAMSRNHLNVLSSDVIVALPGGPGTASEVALAQRYGKPVAAYLGTHGTILGCPEAVPVLRALGEVQAFVRSHVPSVGGRGGP